jgi:predicted permease
LLFCTVAIGCAAHTALLAAVNGVVRHPLGYAGESELYLPVMAPRGVASPFALLPGPEEWRAWTADTRLVADLQWFATRPSLVRFAPGEQQDAMVGYVSPGFLAMVGERALLGRGFVDGDTVAGAPGVAMLGEGTWKRLFGGRPDIVGNVVSLDDRDFVVVGVLPAGFRLPAAGGAAAPDIWVPSRADTLGPVLRTMVRLRAGQERTTAAGELDAVRTRMTSPGAARGAYEVQLQVPEATAAARRSVVLLWAAGALLLLIAAANAAHLTLFRAAERRHAYAVHMALGATPGDLLVLVAGDVGVLALAAAVVGTAVGAVVVPGLWRFTAPLGLASYVPRVDGSVILASVTIGAVVTAGLMGLSYWQLGRGLRAAMISGQVRTATRRDGRTTRRALLFVEMGVSTVLLCTAALFVHALRELTRMDPGFEPRAVAGIRLSPVATNEMPEPAQAAFTDALARDAAVQPAVVAVARGDNLPPHLGFLHGLVQAEGAPSVAIPGIGMTQVNRVSRGYFSALGMRILEGTTFRDTSAISRDVVINASLARLLWGQRSPIGRRWRVGTTGEWLTVTGVVADAVLDGTADAMHQPAAFVPLPGDVGAWVIVRTREAADMAAMLRALRSRGRGTDPVLTIQREDDAMAVLTAPSRALGNLVMAAAVLALFLSAVGLYAVLSYSVALRRKEFAIRMALGATPSRIAMVVMAEGLVLAGCAFASGAVVAQWGARIVAAIIPGAGAGAGASTLVACACLLVAAVVACWRPTMRATRAMTTAALAADT